MSDTSSEALMPEAPTSPSSPSFSPTTTRKDGDVILESTGNVRFRVHSVMLREASRVFATMLSIPQPYTSLKDGDAPILPMPDESTEDIDFVLQCIYPNTQDFPVVDTVERAETLLRVAQKWDFPRVLGILSIALTDLLKRGCDAFHIWALATQYDFQVPRQAAADQLIKLKTPIIPIAETHLPTVFKSIDAFEYACLLSKSAKAIGAIANGPPLVNEGDGLTLEPETCIPTRMFFEDGDVILRSNDYEEFRVHRSIVAQGSGWLSTQVATLPKTPYTTPFIDVAENRITINWILRSIYPDASIPIIQSITEVESMLQAASRLHAPRASFILAARLMEMVPTEDPLSIWALATSFGRPHDKARIMATKRILRDNTPIIRTNVEPSTILRSVTAYDLANLLMKCADTRRKAEEVLNFGIAAKCCFQRSTSGFSISNHGIDFKPTFAEMSGRFGPFNDTVLSTVELQLEIAQKQCSARSCGVASSWESRKTEFSEKRAAIWTILNSIS